MKVDISKYTMERIRDECVKSYEQAYPHDNCPIFENHDECCYFFDHTNPNEWEFKGEK